MNKESYNKIVLHWAKARNNAIVNKPIIDFAAKIKPNGKILDIGCGTGKPIAKYLSDQHFIITGIDVSDKMIECAKANDIKNANFLQSHFFDFVSDEPFDGIIAWDSLFHFPKNRQIEIYSKIYKLLNADGFFLFTHGKQEDEHVDQMFGESFYYSCLSKDYVLDLLNDIGFKVIFSTENFVEGNDRRDWVVLVQKSPIAKIVL